MMWADLPVVVERRSGGRQEPLQVIHRDAVSGQTGRVFSFRSEGQGLGQGSSEVRVCETNSLGLRQYWVCMDLI